MSELKGKIYVFEGSDCSGKQTQSEKVFNRLREEGHNVIRLSYPDYNSPACGAVKMYLAGEFGSKAESVNPKQASIMYATDRVASYLKDWKEYYDNGGIIIMDRYVSSNIVHQAAKFDNINDKMEFVNWCLKLEHKDLCLPTPDKIFFLNMPVEFSIMLNKNRNNKINGEEKKDIHEKDTAFLEKSYNNAFGLSKTLNWDIINCTNNNELRTLDEIHEEIYEKVITDIKKDI